MIVPPRDNIYDQYRAIRIKIKGLEKKLFLIKIL